MHTPTLGIHTDRSTARTRSHAHTRTPHCGRAGGRSRAAAAPSRLRPWHTLAQLLSKSPPSADGRCVGCCAEHRKVMEGRHLPASEKVNSRTFHQDSKESNSSEVSVLRRASRARRAHCSCPCLSAWTPFLGETGRLSTMSLGRKEGSRSVGFAVATEAEAGGGRSPLPAPRSREQAVRLRAPLARSSELPSHGGLVTHGQERGRPSPGFCWL